MGFNGPVGLDYSVIQHDLDRRGVSLDDYDDLLEALRVIERAVLDERSKDG